MSKGTYKACLGPPQDASVSPLVLQILQVYPYLKFHFPNFQFPTVNQGLEDDPSGKSPDGQ